MSAATAASLLVHGWLLTALPINSPSPAVDLHPGGVPLTVRIAPARALPTDNPLSREPERRRRPLAAAPAEQNAQVSPGAHFSIGAARPDAPTPALAPVPDPRYYLARELDSYPTPLSPLRFRRPADGGAEEVLLEILVDERGVVQDVIVARPAERSRVGEELRAVLAAIPFLPAHKDGRVVRSRLVLRVRLDPEDGK